MNRDIFIADAHLLDPRDHSYQRFVAFLDEQRGRLRTLYLLGDLFEFWVGYRHTVFAPYVEILGAFQRLRAAGTELVLVEGNHDFHLGPFFSQTLRCQILPDGGWVHIDGRRVHISHGDLINRRDRGYLLLRRVLRGRLLRLLMAVAPPDLCWAIARRASLKSQQRRGGHREHALPWDEIEKFAREQAENGCDLAITAHFHQNFTRQFGACQVWGLGDWQEKQCYLLYEEGRLTLCHYH